jgi:hypothetical protein
VADVLLDVNIAKTKTVSVDIDVDITKDVDITVQMGVPVLSGTEQIFLDPLELPGAAEALAIVNQVNEDNQVNPDLRTQTDIIGMRIRSGVFNSILSNAGIVHLNQDAGNNNNQANVVALAYTETPGGFAHGEAGGEQINRNNRVEHREDPANLPTTPIGQDISLGLSDDNFNSVLRINGSINDNVGIVGVNQAGGSNNNQLNSVAIALGVDVVFALSEAALGQENTGNEVVSFNTLKKEVIEDSIQRNNGIIGVNQSVGNNNNQGNNFALAASTNSGQTFSNLFQLRP